MITVLSAPFELRKILDWSLEMNPLPPRDEDMILRLMLEPVELVLARPMIERLVDLLTKPLSTPKVGRVSSGCSVAAISFYLVLRRVIASPITLAR